MILGANQTHWPEILGLRGINPISQRSRDPVLGMSSRIFSGKNFPGNLDDVGLKTRIYLCDQVYSNTDRPAIIRQHRSKLIRGYSEASNRAQDWKMLAEWSTLGIAASLFAVLLFAWPLLYKCLQVSVLFC